MRATVLQFLIIPLLLGPPEGLAAETPTGRVAPVDSLPRISSPDRPAPSELQLTKVRVEKRAAMAAPEGVPWPERGSFLWVVGAIVVAGIILAVLL